MTFFASRFARTSFRRSRSSRARRSRSFESLENRRLLAVTLSVDMAEIAEAGGTAMVSASLPATATQDVTVELGFSGNATRGTDYTATATSIVIPTGSQSGVASITALQDGVIESDETVDVDVVNVFGDVEDGTQQVTITILDDDDSLDPRLCSAQGDPVAAAPFNLMQAYCLSPVSSIGAAGEPAVISETGGVFMANADGRIDAVVVLRPQEIELTDGNPITYTATANWTTPKPDAAVRDLFVNLVSDPIGIQVLADTGANPPLLPTELTKTDTSATITMRTVEAADLSNMSSPRIERYHMRILGLEPNEEVNFAFNATGGVVQDQRTCSARGDRVAAAPFNLTQAYCLSPESSIGAAGEPAVISETDGVFVANADGRIDAIVVLGPQEIELTDGNPITYTATANWTTPKPDAAVRDLFVNLVSDPIGIQVLADTGANPPLLPTELTKTDTSATITMRTVEAADLSNMSSPRIERYHMRILGLEPNEEVSFAFNATGGVVVDAAPVLSEIGRQTISETQDVLEVALGATDANPEDTLIFDAVARTAEYYLDQTIGLNFAGDFFVDFGGLGEKWLLGDDGTWFYVTPGGNFYEWLGGGVLNRTWLAQLSPATFADPSLLYEPQADAAAPGTASVTADTLTLDPADGFVGSFAAEVSVSDGENARSQLVLVDVIANEAPVLNTLSDQALSTTEDALDLELSASDSPGDSVTFTATVESAEYYFDRSLGLEVHPDGLFQDWSGTLNEKWLVGGNGSTWYFLTPDGTFRRWLGGDRGIAFNSELIAEFSPSTYVDPTLLYDARQGVSVPATVEVTGTTLTVNPSEGFTGIFAIVVTATDSGGLTDSQLVRVDVTPAAPLTVASGVPRLSDSSVKSPIDALRRGHVARESAPTFTESGPIRVLDESSDDEPARDHLSSTTDNIDVVLGELDAFSQLVDPLVSALLLATNRRGY